MLSMSITCTKLVDLLNSSIKECIEQGCDSILLSGGLDSSILAVLLSKNNYNYKDKGSITAICIGYSNAKDLMHASMVADRFNIKCMLEHVSIDDILEAVQNVIRIMKTFDPMEVRNSSVLYLALKRLSSNGYKYAMTGDGSDEIFAGYNYMLRMSYEELKHELSRLEGIMHFSSIDIARYLGMNVFLPYLNSRLIDYARSIPVEMKVNEYNGKRYGKFILRVCFEHILGKDIAWRDKMAMEQGANTSIIKDYLNSIIEDSYFESKRSYYISNEHVSVRDKEHLYYYEVYRRFFDPPYYTKGDYANDYLEHKYRCPSCYSYINSNARFCRVCGAYPIKPIADNLL
jgi:asparagine synthase (glutamine-hydrolysing)